MGGSLNGKYMNGSLFAGHRYMNGWVLKCQAAHP